MYLLSTDGFANSFANRTDFLNTCKDYYKLIKQYGIRTIKEQLRGWLAETSELGCGDDITTVFVWVE